MEKGKGYRGTAWDWPVIPLIAGLFLIANWVAFRNGIMGTIGVALVVASTLWLVRRRSSSPSRSEP